MAQWVKTPDNHFLNIAQMEDLFVAVDPTDEQAYIMARFASHTVPVRGPFASPEAAQTALNSVIGNLGGNA